MGSPTPTNGSCGIVQVRPWFLLVVSPRSDLPAERSQSAGRLDLNNPPIGMGGIGARVSRPSLCRLDLNHPPTAVGGIMTFCAKPPKAVPRLNDRSPRRHILVSL